MFKLMPKAWSSWQAKSRFLAPLRTPRSVFFSPELLYPELQSVLTSGGPMLKPYEGMAAIWDSYGILQIADYPGFLEYLMRHRGSKTDTILDLACGTGVLTPRLTGLAPNVVGLDVSEHMLRIARDRYTNRPEMSFTLGDFRNFNLDRQFDAAVCASNSLNYLDNYHELTRVFAAVGRHLKPGGLFLFDVVTEFRMKSISGNYLHIPIDHQRLAIHFSYDSDQRRETARAVLCRGIETHRRIPIDASDIITAAEDTSFAVEECFSYSLMPWARIDRATHLYVVLSKND